MVVEVVVVVYRHTGHAHPARNASGHQSLETVKVGSDGVQKCSQQTKLGILEPHQNDKNWSSRTAKDRKRGVPCEADARGSLLAYTTVVECVETRQLGRL